MHALLGNMPRAKPGSALRRFYAIAAVFVSSSCYAAQPARRPEPIVPCASDADCMPGQACMQTLGLREPLCLTRCVPNESQRCASGALCEPVTFGLRGEVVAFDLESGFCVPGAGLPETADPQAQCRTPAVCRSGESCWYPIQLERDGMCAPLCGDDTECPSGSGCVRGGCLPICDHFDPRSCPAGMICRLGMCETEANVADCGRLQEGNVPNNCPLGTACEGSDEEYRCVAPTFNGDCPDDSVFFWWTLRCYPRAELRPVR